MAKEARIVWLDVMKALLIILMVMGHTGSPFLIYIYLFHMSAFFVLSGYTFRGERYSTGTFIKKKALTILLPAYAVNFIYHMIYWIFQKAGIYERIQAGDPIRLRDRVLGLFLRYDTTDLGGATWFLLVLFEVEVLFRLYAELAKRWNCQSVLWVLAVLSGAVSYGLKLHNTTTLPYSLDLALMGCLYFGIGVFLARTNVRHYLYQYRKLGIPVCLVLTWYFGHIYFRGRLPMNWPSRNFKNVFLQLTAAFGPAYLTGLCAMALTETRICKVLTWIGRHTYCIVVSHFAALRLIYVFGVLAGKFPEEQLQQLTPMGELTAHGGWIFFVFGAMELSCLLAWAAEHWCVANFVWNAKLPEKTGMFSSKESKIEDKKYSDFPVEKIQESK